MVDCLPVAVVRPPVLDDLNKYENVIDGVQVDALESSVRKTS